MTASPLRLVLAILALTLLGGCASNNLQEENEALTQENVGLRNQLADRDEALESANYQLRELENEQARLQQEVADARRAAAAQPAPSAAPRETGFENIPGVTGSSEPGSVTATVESDILFQPGSADLRASARQALDAVANVLQDTYAGRTIQVSGHTDTDPIRKSGYDSNYHLGFARAFAVREYLMSQGVNGDRMFVASFGPDEPAETKAKSRRVEITVLLSR